MMCSFYFCEVYDSHNSSLNFTQKINLFPDIYFRTDIMMEMVKKDTLITFLDVFGQAQRIE